MTHLFPSGQPSHFTRLLLLLGGPNDPSLHKNDKLSHMLNHRNNRALDPRRDHIQPHHRPRRTRPATPTSQCHPCLHDHNEKVPPIFSSRSLARIQQATSHPPSSSHPPLLKMAHLQLTHNVNIPKIRAQLCSRMQRQLQQQSHHRVHLHCIPQLSTLGRTRSRILLHGHQTRYLLQ